MQSTSLLLLIQVALFAFLVSSFKMNQPRIPFGGRIPIPPSRLMLMQQQQQQQQRDAAAGQHHHLKAFTMAPTVEAIRFNDDIDAVNNNVYGEGGLMYKRLRGEPIRFGKRREPIRFGKRSDDVVYFENEE